VDLFGPLPSKKHVVVIQDLASRFPVAKLVNSTSATSVLPTLGETYDLLGNPENQLSDNGPPFNSKAMQLFADKRSINLQKTPPLHPSANPVETFMKPLGKPLKIASKNKIPEPCAIKDLLESYRDTPHPATNVPPNAMIFRDQPQTQFPRRTITDDDVDLARSRDKTIKQARTDDINESKYKQSSAFKEGDHVLLRNRRTSKFHPYFSPDDYTVIQLLNNGTAVKVQRENDRKIFIRHPNDLKATTTPHVHKQQTTPSQEKLLDKWRAAVMSGKRNENEVYHENSVLDDAENTDIHAAEEPEPPPVLHREDPIIAAEPPQTPPQAHTPRGRGRGRGRPPGQKRPPQLQTPPTPQQFPEDAMPVLDLAVRRSERVAKKNEENAGI
jgi:ribosomal protein L21E